ADLAAFLESMRFMLRVEVADLSAERAVVTVAGPERATVLDAVRDALPAETVLRPAADETDLFLPAEALAAVTEALTAAGARPAGLWAYEARRIALHRPRLGLDTDHRAIAHEMGWIGSAVHLEKGCYPGQETVARVHNLGRPPRRLVMLHLDGTAERLPERGAAIELDGRSVGFVGSSARHFELGPIALGLVKRTVPVDAEFVVDGIAAGQEVVVSPDPGANAQISLRRRPSGPVPGSVESEHLGPGGLVVAVHLGHVGAGKGGGVDLPAVRPGAGAVPGDLHGVGDAPAQFHRLCGRLPDAVDAGPDAVVPGGDAQFQGFGARLGRAVLRAGADQGEGEGGLDARSEEHTSELQSRENL